MSSVKGRIIYVEPNDILAEEGIKINKDKFGSGFTENNNISWNPEDLNMSIDLQVIIPERDYCGQFSDTFSYEKLDGEGLFGHYRSFFEGDCSKDGDTISYLSTNYTDMSYTELMKNHAGSRETLGIESIDISFSQTFFPQVTMRMTDVHGYSLMATAEQQLEDMDNKSNNDAICRNFFSSLFHFPYPRFALSVKGFYGTRVTFILNLTDFKSSFNSSTGNFDITLEFIGSMYGVYSDIPFNYLLIAPYLNSNDGEISEEGRSTYWDSKIKDGTFVYSDGVTPIMTFVEYWSRMQLLPSGVTSYDFSNESAEALINLNSDREQIVECQKILDEIGKAYSDLLAKGDASIEGDYYMVLFSNAASFVSPGLDELRKMFRSYNNKYGTNLVLSDYWGKVQSFGSPIFYSDGNLNKSDERVIALLTDKSIAEKLDNISTVYKYMNVHIKDKRNDIEDYFKKESERLSNEIEKNNNILRGNQRSLGRGVVGFDPTIENFFRMFYAHIDTFMTEYYDVLKRIHGAKEKESRRLSHFNISANKTDIMAKNSECFMPPYTAFFEKGEEGKNKYARKYPSDMINFGANPDIAKIDELRLVEKMINSTTRIQNYYKEISELSENVNSAVGEDGSNEGNTFDWKATSFCDLFYDENPYSWVNESSDNGRYLILNIVKCFIMRAINAKIVGFTGSRKDGDLNKIAEIEAENVFNIAKERLTNSDTAYSELSKINGTQNTIKQQYDLFIESAKSDGYDKQVFDQITVSENNSSKDFRISSGEDKKDKHGLKVSYYNGSVKFDGSEGNTYEDVKGVCRFEDTTIVESFKESCEFDKENDDIVDNWFYGGDVNVPSGLYWHEVDNDSLTRSEEVAYTNVITNYNYNMQLATSSPLAYSHLVHAIKDVYDSRDSEFSYTSAIVTTKKESSVSNSKYINAAFDNDFIMYNESDGYDAKFRAFVFLCGILGTDCIMPFSKKKSGMAKMPAYIYYFLGGLSWWNRESTERPNKKYDDIPLNKKGLFNNFKGKSLKKLTGFTNKWNFPKDRNFDIDDIKELLYYEDSIMESDFEEWAEENFNAENGEIYKVLKGECLNASNKNFENYGDVEGNHQSLSLVDKCFLIGSNPSQIISDLYLSDFAVLRIDDFGDTDKNWKSQCSINGNCVNAFIKKLYSLISEYGKEGGIEKEETELYDIESEATKTKNELYYTLKNMYDKWACGYPLKNFKLHTYIEDKSEKEAKVKSRSNGGKNEISEYNNFMFVDVYYNDISDTFLVNPSVVYDFIDMHIKGEKNMNVLDFLFHFAQNNNLLFMALPVYNNMYDEESMKDMFRPHSLYDGSDDNPRGLGNTYVFMYTYQPSKTAYIEDFRENGIGYNDDSLIIADHDGNITLEANDVLNSNDDNGLPFSSFGVSFSKQNQSYFKSINVNMDDPKETDISIYNRVLISQEGAKGSQNSMITIGQNMFNIYSTRSFQCSVEMMGCMNIMPNMYFQLNNVPMFRGAYVITNVEHHIGQGTMTTKFAGVKMPKIALEYTNEIIDVKDIADLVAGSAGAVSQNSPVLSVGNPSESITDDSTDSFDENVSSASFTVEEPIDTTGIEFDAVAALNSMSVVKERNCSVNKVTVKRVFAPYNVYRSCHFCAQAVKEFVWAGFSKYEGCKKTDIGYKFRYGWQSGYNGFNCYKILPKVGFKLLKCGEELLGSVSERAEWCKDNCQPGDICVMRQAPREPSKPETGHICMFAGDTWVSDYNQKNSAANPYDPYVYGKKAIVGIMIFRFYGNINLPG